MMKLLRECTFDRTVKCAHDLRCSKASCKIWEKTHPKKDKPKKIEKKKEPKPIEEKKEDETKS